MLRTWLVPVAMICCACSNRVMLSGLQRSDSSVTVDALERHPAAEQSVTEWTLDLDSAQSEDTLTGTLVPVDDTILGPSGELPRLVLRCEAGQVGAYVVMDDSDEQEPDPAGADYVRVELDSAQSC